MSDFARRITRIGNEALRMGAKEMRFKFKSLGELHFQKVKSFIIERLRQHPVSIELIAHTNPSNYIERGTLFGFLGFQKGRKPVDDLIKYLIAKITRTEKFTDYSYISKVFFPDFSDMSNIDSLKMPWMTGISWPEAIQSGVSGLGYFLPSRGGDMSEYSRSQEGIQVKNKVNASDMAPIRGYIDDVYNEAKKIRFK